MTANAPRLSEIRRQEVRWLYPQRLAFGKMAAVDGDPGLGKSTLLLDLIARATTGEPFPFSETNHHPFGVLLLSAEDDPGDTIRPRLEAAGADLSRVTILQDVDGKPPELPRDLPVMRSLIEEDDIRWMIWDPLMAYLSAKVDSSRDQDIRGTVMFPAKEMAEESGVAITFTRHLNKMGGTHPLYRGGGSIAIIGAVRSGLLVAADPDDESRRILAVSKSNLAPQPPALAFRLENDTRLGVARVVWEGPTDHKAAQLLSVASDEERGALGDAADFLREVLEDGPVPSKDVLKQAREAGVSERTLRRAKKEVRVVATKMGAVDSRNQYWVWELPEGCQTDPKAAKAAMESSGPSSETATETPWPSWPSSGEVGSLPSDEPSHASDSGDSATVAQTSLAGDIPATVAETSATAAQVENGHRPPWTFGDDPQPCIVCGQDCIARSPEGDVQHPGCTHLPSEAVS